MCSALPGRFLSEGLVFRNSYVQIAVCGPSRSSLLTGRRPDSTHINAARPDSWCWCQRGDFATLPRYFREQGYVTAGGGKIFHPSACNQAADGDFWRHVGSCGQTSNGVDCPGPACPCNPLPKDYKPGATCNTTHAQGDDPNAWSLPYYPPTDTVEGMDADCIQWGVVSHAALCSWALSEP